MAQAEKVPADWLVDLVNEYSVPTRSAAGEQSQPYPDPASLPLSPAAARGQQPADLAALADRLFPVFAAAADPVAVAEQLEPLLADCRIELAVAAGRDGVARVFTCRPGMELQAGCALTLLDFIEANGGSALGCCKARRCTDVYVDHSPGQTRQYCSDTCHTRERVARHRTRRAAASAAGVRVSGQDTD